MNTVPHLNQAFAHLVDVRDVVKFQLTVSIKLGTLITMRTVKTDPYSLTSEVVTY